ncbi:hypothetical protein [Humisphaera borealis]|uniref:PEP-CTERM sorting domain-containing protein n=1 Tax=Humisphaera borealis TaxID=2807512 RepID=A0A7M2WS81_9BACT|nr:hypothetical protein [Humisphaera borealis]QOV88269.1 hypothetical protein IPV69_18700 [Humisphaera borealis]
MLKALAFGVCVAGLAVSTAQAHYGQRVWVDVDGSGKIVTYRGPAGDRPNPGGTNPYLPGEFSPWRIFARDMGDLGDLNQAVGDGSFDDDGVNYATQFAGYEAKPVPATTLSGTFRLDIVGEVKYFVPQIGATLAHYVPASTAFAGNAIPRFTVGDSATFGTSPLSEISVDSVCNAFTGGGHGHPQNTLVYPNQSSGNDLYDGIYALGLRLRNDNYTTSDTFYLILGKNASLENLQAAHDVAAATLVPEPASITLLAFTGLLLRRSRSRRN